MSELRLITIPMSHYCEKARWALEYHNQHFQEDGHVQGISYFYTFKAARSRTVPILITPEKVIGDSTDILKYLDEGKEQLYPKDPALRAEVEAWEHELDENFGPASRLYIYHEMFKQPDLVFKYATAKVPRWEQKFLPLAYPLIKRSLKKILKIDNETLEQSKQTIADTFEKVEAQLKQGHKYLLSDQFSAADLTFACMAAPLIFPPNYGIKMPELEELHQPLRKVIEHYRSTIAGKYAIELYRKRTYI